MYYATDTYLYLEEEVRDGTISSSNVSPVFMHVCVFAVGGRGEEAQSLLGLQLGRPSESDLLRQLWQLHGAPALAQTCRQGTADVGACVCVCVALDKGKDRTQACVPQWYSSGSAALYIMHDCKYEIWHCTHWGPTSRISGCGSAEIHQEGSRKEMWCPCSYWYANNALI